MRIYVKKVNKGFLVYKETLTQSITSDAVTMLVMVALIGLDVLFSIYIARSVVIDVFVCMLLIFYMGAFGEKKTEVKTKEETEYILNEILKK